MNIFNQRQIYQKSSVQLTSLLSCPLWPCRSPHSLSCPVCRIAPLNVDVLPSSTTSVTFLVALSLSPQSRLPGLSACHCSWLWFIARYIRAFSPSLPSLCLFIPPFQTLFSHFCLLPLCSCLLSLSFIFVFVSFAHHSPLFVFLLPLLIQGRWSREILWQEIYWG